MALVFYIVNGITERREMYFAFCLCDYLVQRNTFIQAIIDFLIIAFFVFLFTKAINKFKKKEEKKEEAKKSDEVVLLEEIRDLLKKNNKK